MKVLVLVSTVAQPSLSPIWWAVAVVTSPTGGSSSLNMMIAPTEEPTHVITVMTQTFMIFLMSSNFSGCSPCNKHVLDPDADHLLCAEDFMDPELEKVSDGETDVDIDLVSDVESDEDVKPYAGLIFPSFDDEYKEYSDYESDTRSVVILRVIPGS